MLDGRGLVDKTWRAGARGGKRNVLIIRMDRFGVREVGGWAGRAKSVGNGHGDGRRYSASAHGTMAPVPALGNKGMAEDTTASESQ